MDKSYEDKKAGLLGEKKDAVKRIEDLSKRHEVLSADLSNSTAEVERLSQVVRDALIAGTDQTKAQSQLQVEKTNLESLRDAISETKTRLKDLKTQSEEVERQVIMLDFHRVGNEACSLLLDNLDGIRGVIESLKTLNEKLLETNRIGVGAGIQIDNDDYLRYVQIMCRDLMGEFDTTNGLPWKLNNIETSYSNVLAEVRKRAKR